MNSIEIISLIYKSVDFAKFTINEMNSEYCKVPGYKVTGRLVSNDGTPEVIEFLKNSGFPYSIFNNKDPNAYYIDRIYTALNYAGFSSEADILCFSNSDIIFGRNWLKNLIKHFDEVNIPCCRLVESGKMFSGKWGVSRNFGRTLQTLDKIAFHEFRDKIAVDTLLPGGLYTPFLISKERFIESGGYPQGNVFKNKIGGTTGEYLAAGDDYYFHEILENQFGMRHVTVADSISYHIQTAERDS